MIEGWVYVERGVQEGAFNIDHSLQHEWDRKFADESSFNDGRFALLCVRLIVLMLNTGCGRRKCAPKLAGRILPCRGPFKHDGKASQVEQ